MKKEYDLRKLKVKRRGAVIPPKTKVMKTVRLDAEVLGWLMAEAAERGVGYQTLLNMLLRQAMKGAAGGGKGLREEIRQIVREEIKRAS